MKHAAILAFTAPVFLSVLLCAAAALAQSAPVPEPAMDPRLASIAAHAAGIAVAIRGIVALLRSPLGGLLWLKVPMGVRLGVLVVLTAAAVGLEAFAAGRPLAEAIFVAIGGLGGAITTHELQERLVPTGKAR